MFRAGPKRKRTKREVTMAQRISSPKIIASLKIQYRIRNDARQPDKILIKMESEPKREDLERMLWDEIDKLPSSMKFCLFMSVLKGKTTREIGSMLGISHQAVSKKNRAALRRLHKGLTKAGVTLSDVIDYFSD